MKGRDVKIVLIGSPNSGKTTLFNWLTGHKSKTVNYPGSTVEYSTGRLLNSYSLDASITDTPGLYSLVSKSPEEEITLQVIQGQTSLGVPQSLVLVADGTQLARHLFLLKSLKMAKIPVVVAMTMSDLLKNSQVSYDLKALEEKLGVPIVTIDGRLGGGVKELVEVLRKFENATEPSGESVTELKLSQWSPQEIESEIRALSQLVESCMKTSPAEARQRIQNRTAMWDRVLLHPLMGIVLFFGIMTALFTSIFWMASPFMDFIDEGFGSMAELVSAHVTGLLGDFLANGIVASFGAVLVFIPQIFILSFGIQILEDSGYLARAATLIDKPFSWFGLNGKSFVPLLSAHACAVPAMMAVRNIPSRKERWLTLFIIPLMTCSARLPVYALLLTFLFKDKPAWWAGLALATLYFGGLLIGALVSLIASRWIQAKDKSFFALELPLYRAPRLSHAIVTSFKRTLSYAVRAGPIIFFLALIIWAGTTFPAYEIENKTERLEKSYAAQMGQFLEPVMKPMGADWRVGVGLISAFAAREVFVSSMAVVFSVAEEDESKLTDSLLNKMSTATNSDGAPLFTVASVIGIIVYFMIALQCMATTGTAFKESRSWKFATLQTVLFNIFGYLSAVAAFHGLRLFGIS